MPKMINFYIRFERNIERTQSCWIWHGSKNKKGYGQIKVGRRRRGYPVVLVHRWAYQQWVGRLRNHVVVMHKCDNPSCANPEHLFTGTQKDNMQDMIAKRRHRAARGPYGWAPRKRKLSDDDVRTIRKDARHIEEIAAAYNISVSHAFAIKSRKRKAHVPD